MVIKKDLALYDRNGEGELIPQERELNMTTVDEKDYPKLVGQTIWITPLSRGEIKEMFGIEGMKAATEPNTTKDEDAEVIIKHCSNPAFTLEELAHAKPVFVRSVIRTIFAESGIKLANKAGTKKIEETEDEFGKNLEGLDKKGKRAV